MNPTTAAQDKLVTRALALSLGAAVALGLARFNYALLLPAMRSSLVWTYAQAGSMNTANALGYLAGALLAASAASRFGVARCFWVSLLLTGMSLLGAGLTDNFTALLLLRLLAGLGGATTFITGATLASYLANKGQGGLVLGLYFGGVGIGIFLAGLGLPQLLEYDAELWRYAWIGMGVLSLMAVLSARRVALTIPTPSERVVYVEWQRFPTHLLPALLAYFLFGLGYISYMTFVVAFLRSSGVGAWALSGFWLLLGSSTFASAFVWRRLLDRAKGGDALAVILAVVTLGAVLPLLSTSLVGVLLSALLFGGTFLSVVSAVTNIIRRSLPTHAWAGGIALFTVSFSVGQTLGPLFSGALADRTDTFTGGFILSALFLSLATILALFQKTHHN